MISGLVLGLNFIAVIANSLVLIGGVILALFQDQLRVNSEPWPVPYQEPHSALSTL